MIGLLFIAARLTSSMNKRVFDKDIQHSLRLAYKIFYYKNKEYNAKAKDELKDYLQTPIEKYAESRSDSDNLKQQLDEFLQDEEEDDQNIPEFLKCPITLDLMLEPILLSSGHTYEKDELTKHFTKNGYIDPLTKETVQPELIDNINLRQAIEDFIEK